MKTLEHKKKKKDFDTSMHSEPVLRAKIQFNNLHES